MYKYRAYGLVFESDVELDECEPIDAGVPADVTIRYSDLQDMVDELGACEGVMSKRLSPDGEAPSRFTKNVGNAFYAYLVGELYIKVSNWNLIEYKPLIDVESMDFHQWMLCYVMTIALIKKHEIIIHCAGLLVPGTDNAVLVCGDSGAGKSTISDALLDRGMLFVSDDSVRVGLENGEAKVYGSYRQRRLCEDVVERCGYDKDLLRYFEDGFKKKWALIVRDGYYGGTPHKLKYLFFLSLKEDGELEFKEVSGADKIKQIMRALYKRDVYKSEGLSTELFIKFANIAKDVKVYRIERPINGMTVDTITDTIMKLCSE
ncbi:MAG: hypothetical protein IK018_10360 [Lachnospiraceae bacterium]|nr:hypothetical protein [Lachnospiraceae bacterium]